MNAQRLRPFPSVFRFEYSNPFVENMCYNELVSDSRGRKKSWMNQNFYTFSHNSSYNRQFPWAISIHAKSEMIDRICPEYGVRERYPSGAFDVTIEGGSEYPDFLGCGAYPFLIVSQTVINDWKAAGITSFYTYPVGIVEVESEELENTSSPTYYRVEIDGRCQIDLKASGLRVIRQALDCHYLITEPSVGSGFRMLPKSWDGSPIFRDVDLYPRINFCTELVLQIARKYKHTNFRFEPMEGSFDHFSSGIGYFAE